MHETGQKRSVIKNHVKQLQQAITDLKGKNNDLRRAFDERQDQIVDWENTVTATAKQRCDGNDTAKIPNDARYDADPRGIDTKIHRLEVASSKEPRSELMLQVRSGDTVALLDATHTGGHVEDFIDEDVATTVQQGHDIKLLTLVSIFFLPLTFLTSVFGTSNMRTAGVVIAYATFCIACLVLVHLWKTGQGIRFCKSRTKGLLEQIDASSTWAANGGNLEHDGLIITKNRVERTVRYLVGESTQTRDSLR